MNVSEFQRFIDQYPQYELLFEYVHGSDRMSAHYRFIPKTRWNRTHAQLMSNLEFLLGPYEAYGAKGFGVVYGEVLPIMAVMVKKRMQGQKYAEKKSLIESPSFLSKCKRLIRMGRIQDPEKHRIKKLKRLHYAQEELRPQGKPSLVPVKVKPKEKKKEKTLTYKQVEAQAKWLAREYARNNEIWRARERERRKLRNR